MKCKNCGDPIDKSCYKIGDVVIPWCLGTIHSNDIRDCYCIKRNDTCSESCQIELKILRLKQDLKALKDRYRWRSVEDEPEEGEEFLIRVESGEIYIAYFDGINWSMSQKGLEVTHWLPLPELPDVQSC